MMFQKHFSPSRCRKLASSFQGALMSPLRNNKGYTIIEVLIAISLMTFVIFTFFSLYSASLRTKNQAGIKLGELETLRDLQLITSTRATCEMNFKDRSLSQKGDLVLTTIMDKNNAPLLQTGQRPTPFAAVVSDIRITIPKTSWASYNSAKGNLSVIGYTLNANLDIKFDTAHSQESHVRSVQVPLRIDAQAKILGCLGASSSTLESLLARNCETLGGVYDINSKKCFLKDDCTNIAPDKPISQKCFANLLTPLEQQLTDLSGKIPPAPTPGSGASGANLQSNITNNLDYCLHNSTDITRTDTEIVCRLGIGYSATVSNTNVKITKELLVNYNISDPDMTQQIYSQAVDTYNSLKK
jgi:pilin/secretion family protein with methylation motif